MPRWEYANIEATFEEHAWVVRIADSQAIPLRDFLNHLGDQGWEHSGGPTVTESSPYFYEDGTEASRLGEDILERSTGWKGYSQAKVLLFIFKRLKA